jgi:Cu/Ag efflux protein CusF
VANALRSADTAASIAVPALAMVAASGSVMAGRNAALRNRNIMRIPTWRLVLTGGAIVLLLALGIGFAAASTGGAPASNTAALPASTDGPTSSGAPDHPRSGIGHFLKDHAGRVGFGKHLVHVTATFTDKDGKLVTIEIDHGTVQAIGTGTLTIAEAGGTTVTVSTDTDTKVWVGRDAGKLSDLKTGDTVFVQSRVDGSTLAKRILEVPATAASTGG